MAEVRTLACWAFGWEMGVGLIVVILDGGWWFIRICVEGVNRGFVGIWLVVEGVGLIVVILDGGWWFIRMCGVGK